MRCKLWIVVILCCIELILAGLCHAESDAVDIAMLKKIAVMNRANRKIFDSFTCEYTMKMGMIDEDAAKKMGIPKSVDKRGKYALKENKEYSRETIGSAQQGLTFIRNGSLLLLRKNTPGIQNLVGIGTQGIARIRPGTQDPWSVLDKGISGDIDNLDPNFGRVTSTKRVNVDGSEYIEVVIARKIIQPNGIKETVPLKVLYSDEKGYLPVKYECEISSKIGNGKIESLRECGAYFKIVKYDVNGNELYLPMGYHRELERNGVKYQVWDYNIIPESVGINSELPDELFDITVKPDDHVVNLDLNMELQGPHGRTFMLDPLRELNNKQEPIEDNGISSIKICDNRKIELAEIPSGNFLMGSPDDEIGYPENIVKILCKKQKPTNPEDEHPLRKIEIKHGFFISAHEITIREYRCLEHNYVGPTLGVKAGELFKMDNDKFPAVVTWQKATEFCKWLSGISGRKVRLPTETEWEYACRAGTQTRFFWGNDEEKAGLYANVADECYNEKWPDQITTLKTRDGQYAITQVGQYKPNNWGLYDIIGNVSEWCSDSYISDKYNISDVNTISNPGADRVCRGGGFRADITRARCASRSHANSNEENLFIGFRIVVEK